MGISTPDISGREHDDTAADLARLVAGQVRFDRHTRMLYSTDASIYQVEPIGVVIPAGVEDIAKVVDYCGRRRIAVLARGGGTSLPGQCTNRAIVVDHSPACRAILSIDRDRRLCHTEPGITVDELNRQLDSADAGLFFAPDPATSAQATIGGCIGNNAAGARSIRYGRTSENVAGLDVVLSDGRRTFLESGAGRKDPVALELARQIADVVHRHSDEIRRRFPKTTRRNAGYALDLILSQLDMGVTVEDLDLSGLICGSEGTLAVVLGARLKLHPVPRSKGLVIASFHSLEEAIEAVPACLRTGASAVELIDDVVLEAAAGNAECRRYMDLLPAVDGRLPKAVLYVEYQETGSVDEIHARFEQLRQALPGVATATYVEQGALLRAWALRKSGEPLLHGMAGRRKPVTCVEDNAVPVENLSRFVAGFKQIITRHGTHAAYWAHASVGVLHVRPMLDLHDPADRDRLRTIAVEVAEWAKTCGGVMSGEHGDGRLRGPLLRDYFGDPLIEAFGEIKRIFDPAEILNPGIIAHAGNLQSMTERLRVNPAGQELIWPNVDTYFEYTDQEGFRIAVETCSGAGVCRKTAGGTMCPSYRATLDERHSTRGRANALRLAISGQLQSAWNDPDTFETLSLCLSCKACKSECPSNVDVARLKAEYTAQGYREKGHVPLQAKTFGHIRTLNQIGSLLPGVANWLNSLRPIRRILNNVLGLAPQRSLPTFTPSLYRWFHNRQQPRAGTGQPKVVLFADCFVTYNEPEIGKAAVRVLEAFGYVVEMPKVGCCGRSMISSGLLADAIRSADSVLSSLRSAIEDEQVAAILVCEPSCLSAMKDDWLQLKLQTDMALRKQLADKAMLVEEFIERRWDAHPLKPHFNEQNLKGQDFVLHGHCHQKALWGDQTSSAILKRILGSRLTVLPSGCCGMAGAFGYTQERYDLSMKIARQSVFTLLENTNPTATILAPGTSCRHQIRDGADRSAVHPVELLARLLGGE